MSHSETFYNELKGHYNSDESNNSRYFSSPSPAMHSRRRPSNQLHDYNYSSPANSEYHRRSSSPLTSSSSPAPMTSPIPIHDDVKIVSRDAYESYHFHDSDSRFSRSNDRDNWRPKLPSFRSLFGNGEHNPAFLSLSPSPKTTLSPLHFPPPPIRTEGSRDRHPSSFGSHSHSLLVGNYDAGDLQTIQPHVQNSKIVLSDHIDTPIHSERKPRQFNPVSPIHPRHSSHQTPTRQKLLFLEADSSPKTAEENGVKFLSPVKGSPYPRRTYFLLSSERGRRSPEPQSTRCGLYQLAEIAEKARSDLPKQTALEQSEESIVDCSSSQFSSPVGYQSSLPPSSPPTSEAQLSPIVPVKSLSPPSTLPLADVMNLTVEPRVNDCFEAHKLLKPSFDTSSFSEFCEEKDFTPITTPVTIVSIQDPADLTSSHGISAVTLSGNIDVDAELAQPLESGHGSLLLQTQTPNSDQESVIPNILSTEDDQLSPDFTEAEPVFADPFSDVSISIPITSSPGSSGALEPAASTSDFKPVFKQLASKSKVKTKTSSSAPPIASSAPRVTVTVVKRMKPTFNTHHGVPSSLHAKGTSTSRRGEEKGNPGSVKGKDKDILKTKTSEVVNSHSFPLKRIRESEVSGKDNMKGLEVPPKKKVKSAIEGTKSSSSSLARAISATYELLPTPSVLQTSTTIPAKRKADDDESSSRMTHVAPTSGISSPPAPPPAATPSPSKTPKKQKVMVLELPVYPRRKRETLPCVPRDIVSLSESKNTTWVDEHWADVLAAAYGSPGTDLSSPAKAPLHAPKRMREETPDLMSESDLTSDDDDEEQEEADQRTVHKTKSPRSIKRMIVESESEEDISDVEEIVARPQFSRRTIVDSSDEEVEKEASSDEEEEDDEISSSDDDDASTGKKQSHPKSKIHFSPSSSLDLELVGIIIETMTLTRSSSHLASALYRTVQETRGGVFETILKTNLPHFDTVTQKLRSQGLIGHGRASEAPTEPTSKRGRPKRGAIANEEGGIAGMSDADIMWVSEFERVMAESAAKCGMFGKVESSFRNDPRDLPLPFSSRFFYVPDCDPDTERAQLVRLTMPGSGKRSETMKYKQYYWKPVGK